MQSTSLTNLCWMTQHVVEVIKILNFGYVVMHYARVLSCGFAVMRESVSGITTILVQKCYLYGQSPVGWNKINVLF